MAYPDSRPGSVFFSPRQPTFAINLLLLLIVVGVAIIIFLLLFWFPKYWGWGGKVIGADGKVMTGCGGIVVNAACCDYCRPGTPPPEDCEDYCRTVYGTNTEYYANCLRERCKPTGCEENCRQKYPNQPTAYQSCVRQCTPTGTPAYPQTPTTPTGTPAYPQTPTCEENCREKYPNQPTGYQACVRQCGGTQTAPNAVLV